MDLKTKVGKTFLSLIDKRFPKNHPLHLKANRKIIKLLYNFTQNLEAMMASQNRKIVENTISVKNKNKYNFKNKDDCPVDNKCCTHCVIYKA